MGSRPFVSTCSARLRLCLWLRSALVRPLCLSPLATSPDSSLDPLLLPSGGLPRSLTRASLPTMLARGLPLNTPPVSLLPPAPTTPSATWPQWFLLATSTLPATPPESVLLSAQDIPTAKQQGCTLCASRARERLHNETSQLVNYVPTKPDKRRDSRYSMFLL